MKIVIESIPHKDHRYSTCGDWYTDEDGTLHVKVSEEIPVLSQQLVALHELVEVFMCQANGVTEKQVDEFDMNYEANRKPDDDSEPGDNKEAPYFVQHGLATAIERIVATQMGVSWIDHEDFISKLFD